MSLYLHPENVKMMWQTIQSLPLFNELFNDPQSKEFWFKKIINQFNVSAPSNLSTKMLYELNRNTVTYMIQDLKTNQFTYRNNIQKQQFYSIPARESATIVGSETDTMFVQRQKEYETMKNEYLPKAIDFSGITDEPITNINELLEKHKNDREQVLAYDHNQDLTPKIKIYNEIDTPKIKIHDTNDVVEFFVDEPPNYINIDKKRVNWNDTSLLERRLLSLENKIDQLALIFNKKDLESGKYHLNLETDESIDFFNKKSYL